MSENSILKKFSSKKTAKDMLRNDYGLALNKKKLLLSIIIDDRDQNEAAVFLSSFLEAIKALSVTAVILVPEHMKTSLKMLNDPRGVFVMPLNEKNRNTVLKASDVSFSFPMNTTDGKMLKLMWQNAVVPIAPASENQVEDYDPNNETGNSFSVRNNDIWSIFAALVRAHETHRFPYDWQHIIRCLPNS